MQVYILCHNFLHPLQIWPNLATILTQGYSANSDLRKCAISFCNALSPFFYGQKIVLLLTPTVVDVSNKRQAYG